MFASIRVYASRAADQIAPPVEAEFADLIAARAGFLWYALLDDGAGNLVTLSLFEESDQAEASYAFSREWTAERLDGVDLTLTQSLAGSIPVSRVTPALGDGCTGRFARVRRYTLGEGELGEIVWRVVDRGLGETMARREGFLAYFVFSSGASDVVTISVFGDRAAAMASDETAAAFVRDELGGLRVQRTDAVAGGEILVSRTAAPLLR